MASANHLTVILPSTRGTKEWFTLTGADRRIREEDDDDAEELGGLMGS